MLIQISFFPLPLELGEIGREVLKEIGQAVLLLTARLKYFCKIIAGMYLCHCTICLAAWHWGQIYVHPDKIPAIINTSFPIYSSANMINFCH